MSAAMRQNVLSGLDNLDAETLDSAKRAARRLGMSLEEWLSHAIAERATQTLIEHPAPRRRVSAPALDELDAVTAKLNKMAPSRQMQSHAQSHGPAHGLDQVLAAASAESERRSRENANKTAVALDSVARWIERAEDRLHETSRITGERQERTAALLGNAIELMTRRLDDIERKVVDGQQPSILAALRAVESLEKQISQMGQERSTEKDQQIESTLRGFEERVASIARKAAKQSAAEADVKSAEKSKEIEITLRSFEERFSQIAEKITSNVAQNTEKDSKKSELEDRLRHFEDRFSDMQKHISIPAQPQDSGLSDAIVAIRSRQSQLEKGMAETAVLRADEQFNTLRQDISRLTSHLDQTSHIQEQALVEMLQHEIDRVHDSLEELATREEVATLESSMRDLAAVLAKARAAGHDVSDISGPVEDLKGEIQRLSEVVTTGLQGHIALDLDSIARKIDAVAQKGVDARAIDALDSRLDQLRLAVNDLADPQRIEKLAEQVTELTRHMARIGARQVDPIEFASLKAAVEDVRLSIRTTRKPHESEELSRHFEALAGKLDTIAQKASSPDIGLIDSQLRILAERLEDGNKAPAQDIISRIDTLSAKLDVPRSSDDAQMRALIERLDNLDHALRDDRKDGTPFSLRAIEDALHHLTKRLDRSVQPDALTQAVLERLDRLEQSLRAQPNQSLATLQPFESALRAISEKLDRNASSQGFAGAILERLDRLELAFRRPVPASHDQELLSKFDHLSNTLKDDRDTLNTVLNPVHDAIRSLTEKMERAPSSPLAADTVLNRLDRLDETLRQAPALASSVKPLEDVITRLDRMDETLRAGPHQDLKPIEDMLKSLAEKIEQAEKPHAPAKAFEALERQIDSLASRLDQGQGSDPALMSLHQAMNDLMSRVDGIRHETADVAVKAAYNALEAFPKTQSAQPEFGFLKRDLADIKASHVATEQRTQNTLGTVHDTLEKVAARLAGLERELVTVRRDKPASSDERMASSPAAEAKIEIKNLVSKTDAGEERLDREPLSKLKEAVKAQLNHDIDEADQPVAPAEQLLEPGSPRPHRSLRDDHSLRAVPQDNSFANQGQLHAQLHAHDAHHLKASFIAAARRAAQAAAAEAAQAPPRPSRTFSKAREAAGALNKASTSMAARVIQTIEKRKRPIILGLAAVVLALGAIQAGNVLLRSNPHEAVATITRPATTASAPSVNSSVPNALAPIPEIAAPRTQDIANAKPSLPIVTAEAPSAAPNAADPSVTGSLPAPAALERITDMSGIGDIPSLAANLQNLRKAAQTGDPHAVYDLAVRAAEGRGLSRDLKLSAKLFEKVAEHGVAPAQYRIGNMYEKGLGVSKDVALARVWYQRAAEKGNARAMHNLAVLTAEGAGGKPDYAGASEWFRRAAEYGVRDSQFNYAVLLARGLGIRQDLAASYLWFSVAASQGDEDAAKKRDEVSGRLSKAEAISAKAALERWQPKLQDPFTNDALVFEGTVEPASKGSNPKDARG
jgi:localization factor PodJL